MFDGISRHLGIGNSLLPDLFEGPVASRAGPTPHSGSCFVQISDQNVHLVRNLLDDVFGVDNFIALISFQKKGSQSGDFVPSIHEYIVWYAKDKAQAKFRRLYTARDLAGVGGSGFELYSI